MFSIRLKWLREKEGFSQKEMAEKVKMSQQGYSNLETGRREPNLETLIKIAEIFEESLDFILGIFVEDYNALIRYNFYVKARTEREKLEDKIKDVTDFLSGKTDDLEEKLNISLEYNEKLRKSVEHEKHAFDNFYYYVITIPVDEDTDMSQEFWINEYKNKINGRSAHIKAFDFVYKELIKDVE